MQQIGRGMKTRAGIAGMSAGHVADVWYLMYNSWCKSDSLS